MEEKLRQSEINLVKVVLFGPESTGKTTLSRQLARHYNTVWAPEYAREYLQDKWNNERKICEKSDLIPIAVGQMNLENSLAKKADKLLVCDTDLLETKVYSEEYYGGFVDPILDEHAIANSYDIYFLTYIDTPWEEDDLRDRPEQREEMFNAFKNALERYNRPYVLLKGDKETRLKKAISVIDKIIAEKENLYSYSDSLIDLDFHFMHQTVDPNSFMH
ncbi:AAA family ATPase [Tenacibaculum amylolyticum]|uniref:AAA family ATPase n=1 Tax=Tenacibaculum amylolyticum TaxID=104269 RepID=UPI003894A36E